MADKNRHQPSYKIRSDHYLAQISVMFLRKSKSPVGQAGLGKLPVGTLPFKPLIIIPPSDTPLHFN